ncbi:MAG: A/G-specific adenine glycosylase, partial [Hyphomonadaceae bacterium]
MNAQSLRRSLLAWYDRAGRELPWRVKGDVKKHVKPDPYRVWLSEIMLQQTTVAAVGPYFSKFLALFPDVMALAAAPREAVLAAWAGLGYYSRARNLHAAAEILATQGFPDSEAGWRALPGVGPYTAAAIAAIALDQPANVVDGNVERVMARFFAVEAPLPAAKAALRARAASLIGPERPGDYAQALMDLGATICTPKAPICPACPWAEPCAARASGAPDAYPRKSPKTARPQRFGIAFRLERQGALWLVRRPEKGLLGGMLGLPTTPWRAEAWTAAEARTHAPLPAGWRVEGAIE